jgi:hypothetical protein
MLYVNKTLLMGIRVYGGANHKLILEIYGENMPNKS